MTCRGTSSAGSKGASNKMMFNPQRRGALALLAVPVAASVAATARAQPPAEGASPVTFETWLRVNTLIQTYADCVDRADLSELKLIFTPTAAYEYGPGLAANGHDGIRDFLSPILDRYARMMTMMATPAITPGATPGTYSSWTSFIAHHEWKNGRHHTVEGRYVDEHVPDPASGELLIARRRIVAQITDSDPAPRFWLERLV